MLGNIAIRKADPSQREEIVSLLRAQFKEHDIDLSEQKLVAAVDGGLESPERGAFHVAWAGQECVGMAYLSFVWALEHGGKAAWLEELYVRPDHREAGIGTRLLDQSIEYARGQGCAAVDLEVEVSHGRVEGLYRRKGFRAHTRTHWVLKLG